MAKQRMVNEFIELTSIPSPTLGERAMAEALKEKLRGLGCEVYEDGAGEVLGGNCGNILARLPGTVGIPVLFSAHMDRVDGGDCVRHVITEDKICTDGSSILAADDIAGVCVILEGLRRLRQSGLPHCDVEVAFTVSEERLARGAMALDYSRLRARHAYCMDSPGHTGRIINAAPGKLLFHIDVYGKAAHAGNAPETGVNALKAAAKILAGMEEGRLDFETTANWALMSGGKAVNLVCDHATLGGEARSRSSEKLNAYADYVRRHCEDVIASTQARCEFRVEPAFDGFSVSENELLVQLVCKALRHQGITPLIEGGGGGMDANRFNTHGIRSIGLATGYFNNHSSREELHLADFEKAATLVFDLIMAWSAL